MVSQTVLFMGVVLFLCIMSFSALVAAEYIDGGRTELHGCEGHAPNILQLVPGSVHGNYCYGD